jgi:hypothetical protein
VAHIARLSLYALNMKTTEDHGSWIRGCNSKSILKHNNVWVDIEVTPHANDSLMEVHVHPIDATQTQSSKKQSICDETMKSFYMVFLKIIEPGVHITDPEVVQIFQTTSRVEKIKVKEVVKERVLVVCSFCGHKNDQGVQFCEKCKASI